MIFRVPGIDQVVRRSYSISSSSADASHFEICVRAVSGGFCSNYIHRLRPGASIQVEGPYGEFALEKDSSRELLMVATGTGISPVKSMILHLLEQKSRRRIRLFFGQRNVSDLFYVDLFRRIAGSHPLLRAHDHPIATQQGPVGWTSRESHGPCPTKGYRGRGPEKRGLSLRWTAHDR